MPRSHPPTLLRLTERTLVDECRLERGERILVAVSGGGDSSALLHVLSILARRLGVSLVAHGVDHGLRPEGAAELDLAESLASRLAVPFARTQVRVDPGGNLQARARDARRKALLAAASEAGATRLATAHHADDRAETVLIRLLHGGTPSGLVVLPPSDGLFVRPLIRARKSDVIRHLARHGLAFASDPSNENARFLRTRVRHEVLPLLEELSPSIVSHLTALADELGVLLPERPRDAEGRLAVLKRAHVQAVLRAVTLGKPARVRLPRGREIVVEPRGRPGMPGKPSGGKPERSKRGETTRAERNGGAGRNGRAAENLQKGGAKARKSG